MNASPTPSNRAATFGDAEKIFDDPELVHAFFTALKDWDAEPGTRPETQRAIGKALTATLGRPDASNTTRALKRLQDKGVLTLDPPAMADWAVTALTGQPPRPAGPALIGLDQITASPLNPRKTFDPLALGTLKDSLLSEGQAQPILVRPHPTDPGTPDLPRYQIIAGERRWRAALAARNEGLSSPVFDPGAGILCTVRDATDRQALALALAENAIRTNPTGLEQCDALAKGRAEAETSGADVDVFMADMAKALGYANTRPIQQMILVANRLIPMGRKAYEDGRMKLAHARTIAGASDAIQIVLITGFLAGKPGYGTEADLAKRRAEAEALADAQAQGTRPDTGRQDPPLQNTAKPAPARAQPVERPPRDRAPDPNASPSAVPHNSEPDEESQRRDRSQIPVSQLSVRDLISELGRAVACGALRLEAHTPKPRAIDDASQDLERRARQLFSKLVEACQEEADWPDGPDGPHGGMRLGDSGTPDCYGRHDDPANTPNPKAGQP